jgi:aminoacrylate hydrolase
MRLLLLKHEGAAAYVRAQPIFLYPADWLARNEGQVAREEAHGLSGFQGEGNLKARISALLAVDARPTLGTLRLPILIAASRDDVLVPSVMSEALASGIEGARLHVAPWGGHALNVTEPAAFNSLLLDFLSCQEATAS